MFSKETTEGLNSRIDWRNSANSSGETPFLPMPCEVISTDGSRSRTWSCPISTTVNGAIGPLGSEFRKSQRRKISSDCATRGSRKKRMPTRGTRSMSQKVGRCIAAKVKRQKGRVTSGNVLAGDPSPAFFLYLFRFLSFKISSLRESKEAEVAEEEEQMPTGSAPTCEGSALRLVCAAVPAT